MHNSFSDTEISEWELSATLKKLHRAYIDLVVGQDCDLFVTLMFNRPASTEEVRDRLKGLLALLDRKFLGRNWQKKHDQRTFMFGVPEHLTTNAHIHCMFRRPWAEKRIRKRDFFAELDTSWKKLVAGGKTDPQIARNPIAVSSYSMKQLRRSDDFGSIILSTDLG